MLNGLKRLNKIIHAKKYLLESKIFYVYFNDFELELQ